MSNETGKPWTPGPWFVCAEPENDCWYAGRTIGSVPDGTRIADVTSLRKKEQALADARLIASAPALYEALADLVYGNAWGPGTIDMAKAALRLARPETPEGEGGE